MYQDPTQKQMNRNPYYQKLDQFLSACTKEDLHNAFSAAWLNELIPGIGEIVGCDQGNKNHLEGDVAVHTALVFEKMAAISHERLAREPDFIEKVAVLLHDLKKPQTHTEDGEGGVTFPDHEALSAEAVGPLSTLLELPREEKDRLYFIVYHHGNAHSFEKLTPEEQQQLQSSPFAQSLALLQAADALSCVRPDGTHLPVYWDEIAP